MRNKTAVAAALLVCLAADSGNFIHAYSHLVFHNIVAGGRFILDM
jgi:hypothetical protein